MSEHDRDQPHGDGQLDDELVRDGELLEAEVVEAEERGSLPVLASSRELAGARWIASPGVQAAAAAATGFVAGAATLALLRRRGVRGVASGVGTVGDALEHARPATQRGFPLRPGQTYIVHVRVLTPRPPE